MNNNFVDKVPGKIRYLMLVFCGIGAYTGCMNAWLFYSYYDLMQVYLGASSTQMGYLGTVCGVGMIFGYILGGMIVDRTSLRKGAITAMSGTAAYFLALLFIKSIYVYLVLQAIGCLFTGISFSTFYTIPTRVSTPEREGKDQGIFWGVYAAWGAISGIAISTVVGLFDVNAAWKAMGLIYAGIAIVLVIFAIIFVRDEEFNDWTVLDGQADTEKSGFSISNLGKVLAMPELWLICLVYFCMISLGAAGTYAVSMMRTIYMVPLSVVTVLSVFKVNIARVILAPLSGSLVDKFKSSMKVVRIILLIAAIGYFVFLLFPHTESYMWVGIILVIMCTVGYAMEPPIWVLPISEIKIPQNYRATATGVYNGFGSIPDAFLFIIGGHMIDTYGNAQGNHYIYIVLAGFLIVGFAATMMVSKIISKKNTNNSGQEE